MLVFACTGFVRNRRLPHLAGRIVVDVLSYILPLSLQRCIYIASDGGRVCRPLVIADNGVSRVKEHHMKELKVLVSTRHLLLLHLSTVVVLLQSSCQTSSVISVVPLVHALTNILSLQDGFRTFNDFLREGLIEYLDVNEENNCLVCHRKLKLELGMAVEM